MAVIGLVALLVLGPEQLPVVARVMGRLARDANRALADARVALEREAEPRRAEERVERESADPPAGAAPSRPPEAGPTAGA